MLSTTVSDAATPGTVKSREALQKELLDLNQQQEKALNAILENPELARKGEAYRKEMRAFLKGETKNKTYLTKFNEERAFSKSLWEDYTSKNFQKRIDDLEEQIRLSDEVLKPEQEKAVRNAPNAFIKSDNTAAAQQRVLKAEQKLKSKKQQKKQGGTEKGKKAKNIQEGEKLIKKYLRT